MSFRKCNLACLMFTGVKKWPTKQHCGQPTIKVTQCAESYSSWRFQQIFLWSLFCCTVCRNSIICHGLNNAYSVNKYFTKPRSQHGSVDEFSFCHVAKKTIRVEDENIFLACRVFNPSSERSPPFGANVQDKLCCVLNFWFTLLPTHHQFHTQLEALWLPGVMATLVCRMYTFWMWCATYSTYSPSQLIAHSSFVSSPKLQTVMLYL